MIVHHDLGNAIELRQPGGEQPLWRYVYSHEKPKPFFHPLCTPSGQILTNFEPADHTWHRGLWFTIKYINEENFWEEKPPFGTQRTELPPTIAPGPDGQISVFSAIDWLRPDKKTTIIQEQRLFTHRQLDASTYAIDFTFILKPLADLLLDRTVFTTWGGYGGLMVRGSAAWQGTRILFPDGTTSDRPTPKIANWCDLSSETAGVAMFDHPDNPRHPTPWYGTTGAGHYINAAFLFNEPMQLPGDEKLALRYRVLVHDGMLQTSQLQAAYDQYVSQERK